LDNNLCNMKIITRFLFGSLFISLLFIGCSDPVEKSKRLFTEEVDTALNNELLFVNSTINFLYYADPQNYWYSTEYTYREILDDRLITGYRGLTRLNDKLYEIDNKDKSVDSAITELRNQIAIEQQKIKKWREDADTYDALFGSAGGVNGLAELGLGLSSESERSETEKKLTEMPVDVKSAYFALLRVLVNKCQLFAAHVNSIENRAITQYAPDTSQTVQIHSYLKNMVKQKIVKIYKSPDTLSRDKIMDDIFEMIDKDHNSHTVQNNNKDNQSDKKGKYIPNLTQ
jgi:hypothetical protein